MEVWQGLFHKNIVPLWGVCTDFGKFASFICPWFDQGNLSRFLKQHTDLSLQKRHKIVRAPIVIRITETHPSQLLGIAEGLTYRRRHIVAIYHRWLILDNHI